jgi:15-cis-phytoene desaturase
VTRVVVLGGGVGGASAAHELVERGFEVEVIELRDTLGGKARSMGAPGTGTAGRADLPGEHGFRFFPGFYRHLPDTMKRIPFAGRREGVFENLVVASEFQVGRPGDHDPILPARFPHSLHELYEALRAVFGARFGIPTHELLHFAERLFWILTCCEPRRMAELEHVTWWNFIGAAERSRPYQLYLAIGLTRSLVAMKAETASARTVGVILIQLLLDLASPFGTVDRVLNGPTSEVWLDPWRAYLEQRGVRFQFEARIGGLEIEDGLVRGALVTRLDGSGAREVRGDVFVVALPVEVFRPLVTPELLALAPSLARLDELQTAWMNGLQIYFRHDVPIVHGHAIYPDTPWALTSISQAQFWRTRLANYGDGNVRGILSIDISDWEAPGVVYGKPARELANEQQIFDEVWAQLRQNLDDDEVKELEAAEVVGWHLDPSIVLPNPSTVTNLEPLLINTVGSWAARPEAGTGVPNLMLAADFVRTYTDLATMEGANEAARRAVNAVLAYAGSSEPLCELWPLHEPLLFAPARAADRVRFELDLPHLMR